jgi:hypothetical protein
MTTIRYRNLIGRARKNLTLSIISVSSTVTGGEVEPKPAELKPFLFRGQIAISSQVTLPDGRKGLVRMICPAEGQPQRIQVRLPNGHHEILDREDGDA